jgi:hypothetical protein
MALCVESLKNHRKGLITGFGTSLSIARATSQYIILPSCDSEVSARVTRSDGIGQKTTIWLILRRLAGSPMIYQRELRSCRHRVDPGPK